MLDNVRNNDADEEKVKWNASITVYGKQVVSEMREIVSKDNQNLTSNSFLLDDDLKKLPS